MKVAEIYRIVQGEGIFDGREQRLWVRASGCNLPLLVLRHAVRPWTPEGEDRSVDEIFGPVREPGCTEAVVLTGGEPMLFAELIPLCQRL